MWSFGHTSTTVLRGLRLVNGFDGDDDHGGAIRLEDSSPLIVDCVFENNTAKYVGGAVFVWGQSSPQFVNCVFRNNGAADLVNGPYGGGAIFQNTGTLTATNCLFHDNRAGEGGAVWLGEPLAASFVNCTFAENEATIRNGGAVLNLAPSTFRNCIFWGNVKHVPSSAPGTVADQIRDYFQRSTITFSDIEGSWTGTGNLSVNPQFSNPTAGNFKISSDSLCINVGDTSLLPADLADLDWDGNTTEVIPRDLNRTARVKNGVVDMGAYEVLGTQGQ